MARTALGIPTRTARMARVTPTMTGVFQAGGEVGGMLEVDVGEATCERVIDVEAAEAELMMKFVATETGWEVMVDANGVDSMAGIVAVMVLCVLQRMNGTKGVVVVSML
jgi:hypothetical protein